MSVTEYGHHPGILTEKFPKPKAIPVDENTIMTIDIKVIIEAIAALCFRNLFMMICR
jgi:hypothetical protein